jgi:hypothetical protein
MQIPQRTQPTKYKKPGRINVVTGILLLIVAAVAYVGYATWPILALHSRVKSEMDDHLPHLWRANLREERYAQPLIARMKKELMAKLPKLGVRDKKPEVLFERGKKRVAIEARFTATAEFPGIDYIHVFHLSPRVETDAARVEW